MTHPIIPTVRHAGLAALALAVLALDAARAADVPERPFNPPVGSHWIIETDTATDELRPDGNRNSHIKSRAELVVETKTADGFHIAYTRHGTTAEGNDRTLPLFRSAVQALDNVTIRATLDPRGQPRHVDNLDEAKAAIRNMAAGMTEPFKDKPQLVAALNQILSGLIEVDADKAAETYLDELPQLAKAQVTGMKQSEVRRSSDAVDNPLGGGAMKSASSFELTVADAATGKRTYVRTTAYDAESLKAFTESLARKLTAAAGGSVTPVQLDSVLKQMVLSLDERAEFAVEDGMTRRISEKSVTAVRALGQSMQKTEIRTITVTPAQ
jgi:hypothetical protein